MIHIYKYLYNWAAQKQADLRQTWVYYPFASTHMVNTQLLRVQNVQFSLVFEFALAEKPRNPRKLMYREYFRVYSTLALKPQDRFGGFNKLVSRSSESARYHQKTPVKLPGIVLNDML